jgi:phage shock protein C
MENQKRLYRSRYDSVIGGVSGGLGNYFSVDPLIIRILFLIFAFVIGGGIIAYIILWIAMPVEPDYFYDKYGRPSGTNYTSGADYKPASDEAGIENNTDYSPEPLRKTSNNGALIAGIFLIVFGFILIADRFIHHINFRDIWPFLVVLIGAFIIAGSFRK